MTQKSDASVFDAWLASACMPPETVRRLLETFGGAEACFSAFRTGNEVFRNAVSPRFLRLLESNGTDGNLKRMEDLMAGYSIGVLRYSDPQFPQALPSLRAPRRLPRRSLRARLSAFRPRVPP